MNKWFIIAFTILLIVITFQAFKKTNVSSSAVQVSIKTINSIKKEVQDLERKTKELQRTNLASLNESLEKVATQAKSLKNTTKNNAVNNNVNSWKTKPEMQVDGQVAVDVNSTTSLKSAIKFLKKSLAKANSEISNLDNLLSTTKEENAKLSTEIVTLDNQLKGLNQQITSLGTITSSNEKPEDFWDFFSKITSNIEVVIGIISSIIFLIIALKESKRKGKEQQDKMKEFEQKLNQFAQRAN